MSTPVEQRHARPTEAGFTILETVIALCVTMVVGLGAIGLFLFAASFNAGASDRARALSIAQESIEELRAKSFTDSALVKGTSTKKVLRGSDEDDEADLRAFNITQTITDDGTTAPANRQKTITVTVTPEAVRGRFIPGGVTLLLVRTSEVAGGN